MYFIWLFILPILLIADTGIDSDLRNKNGVPVGPWLTGPLLTTSAYTIPVGHANIEPYALFMHDLGVFTSQGHVHSSGPTPEAITSIFYCQIGLTDNIDITLYPQFTYNYGMGGSRIGLGDIAIGTSCQLIRDDPAYHGLTCRVGMSQVFPCGKFQNLNPLLSGSDAFGSGGWSTRAFIAVSNYFHLRKENFLAPRASLSTIFYSPVELNGHNYFGGDGSTKGVLNRGISVILDAAFELTLSLHWALAFDIENMYTTGSTFNGRTEVPVGNPKNSYLLSIAPAIEYNFSKNYGVICGIWYSPYGVNIESFSSIIFALNMYL